MEIISVSVDAQTKKKIEDSMQTSGCKSRSKLVAMAIDSLARELAPLEGLTGAHTAVITVVSNEETPDVSHIIHQHPGIVKLNSHLDSKRGCAEILVVEGDAKKIRELYKALRNTRDVKSVNFALA